MNISAPFIHRPIATALLMIGLLLGGLVTYRLLPVAALPNVNFPTIQVTAQLPGARSPGVCLPTTTVQKPWREKWRRSFCARSGEITLRTSGCSYAGGPSFLPQW